MIQPMDGVRVLEVAQFTFVPAAGAVLADWGADVIKVEHAETGDAQRGLSRVMDMPVGSGSFAPLMEHPNRGKRSIGLALERPEALDVLHELMKFGIHALVVDPLALRAEVKHEYGLTLADDTAVQDLDALILAVPHKEFLADPRALFARLKPGGLFVDVKSALSPKDTPSGIQYWSL